MLKCVKMIVLVTAVGLICGTVFAGPFGKKDKDEEKDTVGPRVRYKYHLHVPSKKTEQELVGMLKSRKLFEEDVKVLRRLEQSRMKGYAIFQKKLREEFDINPKRFYALDRETATIYDVTDGEEERTEHMRFDDSEKANRFLSISAKKKSAFQEVGLLQRLLKEQQTQLHNVNKLLNAKFSLNNHKGYYYDKKSMILYEVIPARRQE